MEAIDTEAPEATQRDTLGPGTISACVVAHNEEAVIERCLASLDGVVDEIIFVHDGECRDRSLEIAERHGARQR